MTKTEHSDFIGFINPTLEALRDKGGSATAQEVFEFIANKLELPNDVLTERYQKSGQLAFNNRVYWAKQYLVWEGLVLISKKGVWALTDTGWNTTLSYEQADQLVRKWVKINQDLSREKKKQHRQNAKPNEVVETEATKETPALLEILRNINPTGFEHLCGRLLREYGFEDIEITRRSNDGGIDGYAKLRINPIINMSVFFQCKRYKGAVPISDIRDFVGTLQINKRSVEKALFLTTGTFPNSAKDIEQSMTELELIDGDRLVEMFEKAELGVSPRTVYDPDLTFFEKYLWGDAD